MRQLGAAAGVGALGGLAGCMSILQRDKQGQKNGGTDSGNNASGNNGGDNEAPPYQIVDLIPPSTKLDFTEKNPERDIVMVTHDASTSFFVPTIAGLHDAAKHVGWNAKFTGPTSGFDVQKQIAILNSVVTTNPAALATSIADADAYDKVIQRALDNDIAIVLYNTNAWTAQQMRKRFGQAFAYTGQNQVGAGYVNGLTMLDKLPDDANKVTVGLSDPGHAALSARAEGMEMAIRQNSDIKLTNRVAYTGQSNKGVSKITNFLTSHPEVDGITGADAFSWFIGDAIKNLNAQDSIVGGGFDLTNPTLQHIKKGNMEYTIGQDPYSQGYIPATQMWMYLERGIPAKDYPTGAEVIDKSNIKFALKRAGGWDALRKQQKS
jgi:simple sugar transport system substrate-binding protein